MTILIRLTGVLFSNCELNYFCMLYLLLIPCNLFILRYVCTCHLYNNLTIA